MRSRCIQVKVNVTAGGQLGQAFYNYILPHRPVGDINDCGGHVVDHFLSPQSNFRLHSFLTIDCYIYTTHLSLYII